MRDEICASKAMVAKTLIGALENLEAKASNLLDLANFSDRVLDKLNNPRPQPEPSDECISDKCGVDRPVLDLIDLFNEVANKLDSATHRIGNNTEKINSIIE